MAPLPPPRWGDDLDDSDEEDQQQAVVAGGGLRNESGGLVIPPTHKSRIDSNGIQIVTSYRQNPSNKNQLLKTVTKQRVTTIKVREPRAVEERRKWSKFGQARLDEQAGVKATVQSKDEIFLEDPNADTDLQDEDPAGAIAGNLNAFWAKQQRRQLERKYDVQADDPNAADAEGGAAAGGGWTQVGGAKPSSLAAAAAAGGVGGGGSGKYVPPSARGGGGGSAMGGGSMFKPEQRRDDLNTLRVTNLSESTTEADLQELFQRFGRISRVYLAKDKETMQSRGFAFVSFVNKDDAARAMESLQGYGYDHLILKIEFARPNAPKDPASSGTEFRSGYGKALAQDTKSKVSYASNLTR